MYGMVQQYWLDGTVSSTIKIAEWHT